jgi:hypothetical protein
MKSRKTNVSRLRLEADDRLQLGSRTQGGPAARQTADAERLRERLALAISLYAAEYSVN